MVWMRTSCEVSSRARSSSALIWLTSASSIKSVSVPMSINHPIRQRERSARHTHTTHADQTSSTLYIYLEGGAYWSCTWSPLHGPARGRLDAPKGTGCWNDHQSDENQPRSGKRKEKETKRGKKGREKRRKRQKGEEVEKGQKGEGGKRRKSKKGKEIKKGKREKGKKQKVERERTLVSPEMFQHTPSMSRTSRGFNRVLVAAPSLSAPSRSIPEPPAEEWAEAGGVPECFERGR